MKESLNSDDEQFHQYRNIEHLKSSQIIEHKKGPRDMSLELQG